MFCFVVNKGLKCACTARTARVLRGHGHHAACPVRLVSCLSTVRSRVVASSTSTPSTMATILSCEYYETCASLYYSVEKLLMCQDLLLVWKKPHAFWNFCYAFSFYRKCVYLTKEDKPFIARWLCRYSTLNRIWLWLKLTRFNFFLFKCTNGLKTKYENFKTIWVDIKFKIMGNFCIWDIVFS